MISPVSFLEYGRITDVLMHFDKFYTLNFTVSMIRKKDDRIFYNHAEYMYYNDKMEQNMISIKRVIDCGFTIVNSQDTNVFLMIRPKDIYMMRYVFDNMILPWYIGDKRIYKFDNNNALVIRSKYTPVELPLSEFAYIKFIPIVYEYADGNYKEGVRMYINDDNNYVDYPLNTLLEFYYYITSVDMYGAAQNMIQYIKTQPYGTNLKDFNSKQKDDDGQTKILGGFFGKK